MCQELNLWGIKGNFELGIDLMICFRKIKGEKRHRPEAQKPTRKGWGPESWCGIRNKWVEERNILNILNILKIINKKDLIKFCDKVALLTEIGKMGKGITWRWGVGFWVETEYLQFKMMVAHLNDCCMDLINYKNPKYVYFLPNGAYHNLCSD